MYPTELTLKSDPKQIYEVEYFVKNFAQDLKIDENIYPNILISVTEAVNNAIIHGNQKNVNKEVKIELRTSKKVLIISVSDQGEGFDPKNVPDPTLAENIEKLGGRGVFLIQQLSDLVNYVNNGRTVEMQFFI
jgi:serine/threonine-protein kinase RsbW